LAVFSLSTSPLRDHGVFVFVGFVPNIAPFNGQLATDSHLAVERIEPDKTEQPRKDEPEEVFGQPPAKEHEQRLYPGRAPAAFATRAAI
jgi:hypothetical protein